MKSSTIFLLTLILVFAAVSGQPKPKKQHKKGAKEDPEMKGKKQLAGGKKPREIKWEPVNPDESELKYKKTITKPAGGGGPNRFKRQQDVSCDYYEIDVQDLWPQCKDIISLVRDQSNCGSCWAVASADAFTDRYCIAKAKTGEQINLNEVWENSAADVMACSGGAPDGNACNGGYIRRAWQFFDEKGVVSGGNYQGPGCIPYPLAPYSNTEYTFTSQCQTYCSNSNYKNPYNDDKYKVRNYNVLEGLNWEEVMKKEIATNGSIVAGINVFSDFNDYDGSGDSIYRHNYGQFEAPHAIRLIGYGNMTCTDGTVTKYWKGINTWNTDWGMEGVFLIRRGTNEVGIETMGIAFGEPEI